VLFPYLDEFCIAYVNDILIFSENSTKHHEHVIQVLEKLKFAELQADIKKSEFFVTKTKFLGYIISTKGIAVDSDKISAVMKWKRPTKVKEL
jgi:GTP cyclohydrolase III